MAAEISVSFPSSSILYAVVRDAAKNVWQVAGQVFEVWGTGGRTAADYAITLNSDGGDLHIGDFDVNILAGHYIVQSFIRATLIPLDSDKTIGGEEMWWDGSAEQTQTEYELIAYGVNTVVPDVAGTAAGLIAALNDPTLVQIADAVHDEAIEGSITLRESIKLFLAVLTGKSSGGGTVTIAFRNIDDSKDRLVVTVDANGNRTAVVTRDGA